MITLEDLLAIMPMAGAGRAAAFLDLLNAAMVEFEINTRNRRAAFLANIAVETGSLGRFSENLNYRPEAILTTFNTSKVKRFTPEQAQQYGRTGAHPADQEMIANIAYANRMGNGDVASGDGWRHRGAGAIQTTGADNQRAVAEHFGIPFEQVGAWLRGPEGACRSAGLYWAENGCNELADAGDFEGLTRRINRALKGYPERVAFHERAQQTLA